MLAAFQAAKLWISVGVLAALIGTAGLFYVQRNAARADAEKARLEVATLTERAAAVISERDAALERIVENNRAIAAMRERADTEAREADVALAELDRRNREWRRRLEVMRPGVDGMNAFVAEVLR